MRSVSTKQLEHLAREFDINLDVLPLKVLKAATMHEMEHAHLFLGNRLDHYAIAFATAIDHFKKNPRYYEMLEAMEHEANEYYKKHGKPSIFLS